MIPANALRGLPTLPVLAVLAGVLLLPGCASYQVTVPDSDPIQVEGQDEEYRKESMNAYLWGFVLDPQVLGVRCDGLAINDVVVDRNFGQDLAGVLTLGLWMPTEVRYRCKAPETRPGEIPLQPSE